MIQFLYNIASTLEFYAPEGIPDGNASLTVYTSGSGELDGTWPQTVTLDGATTTTTAAGELGDTSIPVASIANFKTGRKYWVKNITGELHQIRLRGLAGSNLYLDQPLSFTFEGGSTVASARYAFDLTAAQNGTLRRRLRAVWSYDVDSVTVYLQQYYSVVREPFQLDITEEDIERHDPAFGEYADSLNNWTKLVHGAHDDIERKLRARQLCPDLLRDRDGLRDALIFQLLGKYYLSIPGQDMRSRAWLKMADLAIDDVLKARSWYDADDDHVVSASGRKTITLADGTVTYVGGSTDTGGDPELGCDPCGSEIDHKGDHARLSSAVYFSRSPI
jgi:hypothetical protein